MKQIKHYFTLLINCGVDKDDPLELILEKQMITLLPIIIGIAAAVWGGIYLVLERPISAAIPLSYTVLSFIGLIHFNFTKNISILRNTQLTLVLLLPFFLMWSLGGFFGGSYVMIWAFYAPLAAMSFSRNNIFTWMIFFIILTVVSFFINPILVEHITPMPELSLNLFSLLNIAAGFGGIFYLMSHFVRERDRIAEQYRINEANLYNAKTHAEEANIIKSQFLANMSHEIRTPMNAIIGMTSLALDSDLNEKQKNYVQKANIAAESLLGIINDILDFSKIEAGKLELSPVHFELKDIISHTLHLISVSSKEKGLKIRVKMDKDVPKIYYADSLRLSQVLINLASNAVKFSNQNKTITLSISLEEDSKKDALIKFSVSDEGIGISEKNQKKLFKSFSQAESSTTRRFGGTGLGLAISKSIIEIMGGNINLVSEEGKGCTFSFTVRMQKSDQTSIEQTQKLLQTELKGAVAKLKGLRILLVEDNELNQELAVDLLENNGLVVTVVNNGKEAIDILETQNFDVILMDCQMPVMDGYEATRIIRKHDKYKTLPILAMTANVMSEDIEKALEAGMNDKIAKPINPEVMFVTLAKWIKA